MFVHKTVLQLVLVTCFTLQYNIPSTSSLSLFDYRNFREPAHRRSSQGLENDQTRFRFGINLARMFQDLVRKFFSTVVTINVNVMGEQTVHVPKPIMDMEPNRTVVANEREETLQTTLEHLRLQRLQDVTEAPVARRVPLIKRMLGIQNGPFSNGLFSRRSDEGRGFRPFSIFGR